MQISLTQKIIITRFIGLNPSSIGGQPPRDRSIGIVLLPHRGEAGREIRVGGGVCLWRLVMSGSGLRSKLPKYSRPRR